MASQILSRKDTASFSRYVEENMFMLEETNGGTVLHLAILQGQDDYAKTIIELCPSLITSTNSKGDTPLHFAARLGNKNILIQMLDDPKLTEVMNKDGLTPLHFAAMQGSVAILNEFLDKAPSSFDVVTRAKEETVFHIAARHKKNEAFMFMAKNSKLGQLLNRVDVDGNNVLHIAASVGSVALVKYVLNETEIKVTTKNKKGAVAVDLASKDDEDFLQLSNLLKCELDILIQHPSSLREMGNLEIQQSHEEALKKLQMRILRAASKETPKECKIQLESLQSARNTIIIVAVLIASVTFSCGINPPGGLYQEGRDIGKSTAAGRTLAFMIFSISNSIALFTSVSIVILLLSIIPYTEDSLLKFLFITHWMMWVAVAAMASAYVAAASVTLPFYGESKWLLYATLAIASLTLGGMFLYLQVKLVKCVLRTLRLVTCPSLPPPKKRSLYMAANILKGYYCY